MSTDSPVQHTDVPQIGYQLPHSLEAEQSVIGGLMLDNRAWDDIADRLDGGMFYRPEHRYVFEAMRDLIAQEAPIDVVTLSEALEQHSRLETVGGLNYLAEIARHTPSAANITAYADIVRDRYQLRQLSQTAVALNRQALDAQGHSATSIIEAAEQQLFELVDDRRHALGSVKEILEEVVDRIDIASQSDGGITGVRTGFTDLDRMTTGLQPAELVILAGRPSMGKSALGMGIAEHILASTATQAQGPVIVFSLEMPREDLMLRMLASIGRLPLQALRSGQLEDDQWPSLAAAVAKAKEFENRLFIDDEGGIYASSLKTRARRIARKYGRPALILVDYLQMLEEPSAGENRNLEISAISRILKATAKELSCPVVALSQLNRQLENRPNKRPTMADLRDSGSLEQDADLIGFVYRDAVYHPDNPENLGLAELILAKQRNGPTGTVHLAWLDEQTRFENLEWKHREELP
ncbi:replicative DNA helicase [Halomonas sabkhae]|uniref:replicative DNA helicase n=1 Tax=Halomonas sabkhae TaxID=626223 RepID=UPI0025B424B1|nr:replicative DNA helicase [Halomonas sabkhae]MDN3525360.1 replicative DNA helicase [Halomonas sabkhae]